MNAIDRDRQQTDELVEVEARDLRVGDYVDLLSCPYCKEYPSAEFEFAEVIEIVPEGSDCVAIDFGNGPCVGYCPDQLLKVQAEKYNELRDTTPEN